MSIPNNPVSRVLRASVAKWHVFKPPFHATAEEIQAFEARRREYVGRVYDALRTTVEQNKTTVLKHVAKVVGEIEGAPPGSMHEAPEPETIVSRVRALLGVNAPRDDAMCSRCVEDGGVRRHLDGPLLPPMKADIGPGDPHGPPKPLCVIHFAEHVYFIAAEAHEQGKQIRCGKGDPFVPQYPPAVPASLKPAVRITGRGPLARALEGIVV